MPLYEYQCDACAHRFEQIQRFSDPPLTACTRCGGAVRKLVSSPAIQFKGDGWYVTDYAGKGRKDPSEAAESKPGAPSEGSASKSEGKDAGKSGEAGGASAPAADSPKPAGPASAAGSSS